MHAKQTQSELQTLSTEQLPESERIEAWRENYARATLKLELEPDRHASFRATLALRALPRLGVVKGFNTPATYRRTSALTDNDDCLLVISKTGTSVARLGSRSAQIADGDVILLGAGETGDLVATSDVHYLSLGMPFRALAPMIGDVGRVLARPVSAKSDGVRLLANYVDYIQRAEVSMSAELAQTVSDHLYDLTALVLGANRDLERFARNRGLRAARLRAIKDDIEANLTSRWISVDLLSKRHGVSPRHIRSLFENEETTFSDFLLGRRLELVHSQLAASNSAGQTISAIAFDAGFGDLSHFNHMFRRRFGSTPSDVRSEARRNTADEGSEL
jgi:AraC-like DNA-binding protein